jgi:hypothetical protein
MYRLGRSNDRLSLVRRIGLFYTPTFRNSFN